MIIIFIYCVFIAFLPFQQSFLCFYSTSAQAPFSYTLSNFNFFCLIHTQKGKAKLTYCQKDYALTSDTIAFIDCNVMHTLTSLTPKWEYTIAFLPYTNIELYYKNCFDNDYDEPFSLEESANKYHINKYRLCREFSAYFGNTPLQYLNNIRIDQAKDLLINTDEKISTIGQMVGFENTNHFIRLFKSKTGVTPLAYRKMTPVITNM